MNNLLLEHIARYHFCETYVRGRVLDIACGVGYGTAHLAKKQKMVTEIIGADIDHATIRYAIQHYYHPLLKFETGNIMDSAWIDEAGLFKFMWLS